MNLVLLLPAGLVALAALLVPVLIHLVRRMELRRTDFAALRWLGERARPRRRVRVERPWLLLVRLALLGLLALLLAQPARLGSADPVRGWVLVAPGASPSAARAALAATRPDAGTLEWRWLAPGFAPLATSAPAPPVPLASLLREADARLPAGAPLHVVVPAQVAGLDGARPVLARAIQWQVVPGRVPGAAGRADRDRHVLAVRHAPDSTGALRWLRAAVAAWNAREPGRYELDVAPATEPPPDDAHWLAWLGGASQEPPWAWIEHGGTALLVAAAAEGGTTVWRDADGEPLARVEALGDGRVIRFAPAFDPASLPALADAGFADRLLALLRGSPPAPTRAPADALRPRHDPAMPHASRSVHRPARPLDNGLAVAVAALFVLERLLAARRPGAAW